MRIKRLFIIQFLFISFLEYAQYNIGERTLVYVDETRDRPLITEIWYPTFDKDIEENSKNGSGLYSTCYHTRSKFYRTKKPANLIISWYRRKQIWTGLVSNSFSRERIYRSSSGSLG